MTTLAHGKNKKTTDNRVRKKVCMSIRLILHIIISSNNNNVIVILCRSLVDFDHILPGSSFKKL